MAAIRFARSLLILSVIVLAASAAFAQQVGSVSGRVTATDGAALPGVTVEARSNALPQPRVTLTDETGEYRLPALQPGTYTLTYSLAGLQTVTRSVNVLLNQNAEINVSLGIAGVEETITVTAEASLVDRQSTELQSTLSERELQTLPLTQDYRDLQKLIPGVMYTQDEVRGPSAGASGQDNVYMFDGVNVTMPLFGVLNIEPNTRDVAQVTVTKGGATAVDFNRAAGFLIDTVSKAGTNEFFGEVSYQLMHPDFVADQEATQNLLYDEERQWLTGNIGGPILPDRLFFYGSYYRPEAERANQANLYGALPPYTRERDEWFAKLTATPLQSLLINASYRDSHEIESSGDAFGAFRAGTTGTRFDTELQIGTFETSWIINPNSFATLKLTDYRNPGIGSSDFLADTTVAFSPGTQLDLANLSTIGRLSVPLLTPGNAAQNAFVMPYIERYGYLCPPNAAEQGLSCTPGQMTGGGTVGYGQFARDDDSFFRKGGQVGFNYSLGLGDTTHDLHVGYQRYTDSEDRFQSSNGWGLITIPAGVGAAGTCPASACGTATPAFFVAQVSQQGARGVPTIHSEFKSQNIELNDVIRFRNWSFNVGVLLSEDTLYGQGLAKADNYAGFTTSPGTKYKMHTFGFDEMIQPRLGATWAYNGSDTVYVSYGRYSPAANSDARAASWDRNLVAQVNVYFDAQGRLIGVAPNASSSGKWWQDGIKHPMIDEIMIGTGQQLTSNWSTRIYGRYREGSDFLEDTNNNARSAFGAPEGISRDDYVPDLCNGTLSSCGQNTIRGSIGSGSTYVIANLDGAFTKYYEATMESSWRGTSTYVNGSYTWSHYYGNFDQDNTSFSNANDTSIFIGSSNIGDGAGRQLWDFKYGDLRGDRRHVLKVNAGYDLPWRASVGAYGVYQSGQPYQLESVLPYRPLTGSTSDTNRYAEPAGRRRSPAHHQLDLKYTQNVYTWRGATLQLVADIFNVYDKQTGFDYETRIGTLGLKKIAGTPPAGGLYTGPTVPIPESISDAVLRTQLGNPADFDRSNYAVAAPYPNRAYAPRRYQIMARVQF
ncbi:MAG TPA: carboxypeptidase regulatory-like domain-containing protein [Thermoanaerobaculia bacterium]|nr:carboxypeptidase regulatory-like domain-containing protein [Thermoanaerobaculia bacterium]